MRKFIRLKWLETKVNLIDRAIEELREDIESLKEEKADVKAEIAKLRQASASSG